MSRSFLAFSCPHVPFHDKAAHAWLIRQVDERQPDVVVCLGDLFEAHAASRWADEAEHDLVEEYKQGAEYLHAVREAAPDAAHVWLHGNHDDNIKRRDARRIPKELRRACDWHTHSDEFKHWRQIPYRKHKSGCLQLGQQVILTHGFDYGVSSDEYEALQFGNYTGQAYCLVVRGHTHRPEPVTQCRRTKRIPLPYWYANAGSMCDPSQMDYTSRRDTYLWGAAIVVGGYQELKSPRLRVTWEAETVYMRARS